MAMTVEALRLALANVPAPSQTEVVFEPQILSGATTDSGDTFGATAHGMSNGTRVRLLTITTTTGITADATYWVVGAATNTFQLAATEGGSAIALTTNGTYVAIVADPAAVDQTNANTITDPDEDGGTVGIGAA